MAVHKVCGTETEYGISVRNQVDFNPAIASGLVVNSYAGRQARVQWSFEEESPGRDARGGASTCGLHLLYSQGRSGRPPFAHDGTERRIVRPQDPAEQTDCYSGKKKDQTVKNVLLVNAPLTILFLSDTYGGRTHDKPIADATPYPLPRGSGLLQDLGFLGFTLPGVEILMPTRKPRGGELTVEQQLDNEALHKRRLRIEHVNSSVKRCRIVKDRLRLWRTGIRDLVMEVCCALHNFRVRLSPWQPMI